MLAGDGWRYIAQRYDGKSGALGDFIDFNVPLQGVSIEDVLSGDNALEGTITPEYPRLKAPDGQPVLLEGGTAIWAEDPSGEIRGGGLVSHSAFNESGEWAIECADLTSTSIDLPFMDAVWLTFVDPIDVFRYIWTHIQMSPGGNVGMSFDTTTSPVRLGTELVQFQDFDLEADPSADPEDLEPAPAETAPPRYATNALWREAAVKAMKAKGWDKDKVDAALRKWLNKDNLVEDGKWEPLTEKERQIRDRAIENVGWPPNPPNPGRYNALNTLFIHPMVNPPPGGEVVDPDPVDPPVTWQYDAYKLNWYSNLDLSSDLADLAANTPFDWHLTHRWEGDEIRHHVRIGYPRLGRRREDLRFVIGENIHTAPDIERDGTEYANEFIVYGAGEGALAPWGIAFRRDDGRVRKVKTLVDPTLTTTDACNARAAQELAKHFDIEDIADLIVSDHPHAPLGSIDLGDEIYVEGDIGWVDFSNWCRVVGRTMSPDDSNSQTLTLIRSDRIG